jgi:hypothetical protein
MSKTFYLICVYLNYIQESKSSTQIVVYSQSQSFTGFPEQEFIHEDSNAKADVIHNMGDDLTLIGSRQEASDDAKRALSDGDDAQRASPGGEAHAAGGPKHPEVVLPNVLGEGDVNAETETADGVVGEVSTFLSLLHCQSFLGTSQFTPSGIFHPQSFFTISNYTLLAILHPQSLYNVNHFIHLVILPRKPFYTFSHFTT